MVLINLIIIIVIYCTTQIKVDSKRLFLILLWLSLAIIIINIEFISNYKLFNDYLIFNNINKILLIFSTLFMMLSFNLINYNFIMFLLIILSFLGNIFLIISYNSLTFILALELQSLTVYLIVALNYNNSEINISSSLKYFILGSLASSLIILGVALNLNYYNDLKILNINLLIIIGCLFKLAVAPFHQWSIDVYNSITNNIISYISLLPKFGILLFLFYNVSDYYNLLFIFSALSIIIGSIGGLFQIKYRKLLAYSSIAQIGYLLVALHSNEILLLYLIQYTLTTILLLYLFTSIDKNNKGLLKLLQTNNYITFSLTILFISLSGIPPLYGFFAKLEIINILMNLDNYLLIIIVIVTSVLSTFYYLRIISIINLNSSDTNYNSNGLILSLGTILLILIFLEKDLLQQILFLIIW